MSDDDAWAEELIGSVLADRYRVDELIGRGGMGVVLAATHLKLRRRVAIKMMHPMLSRDSTIMQRFHQEAQAAASVGSDGVVEVSDFDDDPEHGPFLVMELLRGESLVEVLKDGRVETPRAIWIVCQLLDVLSAVHAKGIIHRDLKPPNVFLHHDEAGGEVVKVVDFGIAKVHARHLTMTGQIVGTPRFMAPEQARGDDVDHRIDLYGAGLLLYCALTGLPPYATVPSGKVIERISQGPPSLRTLRPDLPPALLDVVDKALEPKPADRFQSAEAMAVALRGVDLDAPSAAASPSERAQSEPAQSEQAQSEPAQSEQAQSEQAQSEPAPQPSAPTNDHSDTVRSDAPVFAPAEDSNDAVGGYDEGTPSFVVPERHGWKYLAVAMLISGLAAGAFFYIKSQETTSIRAALESEGACEVPQGQLSVQTTTTGLLFEELAEPSDSSFGRLHIEERAGDYHISVGAGSQGYAAQVRPGTGPRHIEVRSLSTESVDVRFHRVTLVGPEGPCVITGEIHSDL